MEKGKKTSQTICQSIELWDKHVKRYVYLTVLENTHLGQTEYFSAATQIALID